MSIAEDTEPKKPKAQQIYEGVWQALNDKCDKLKEELDKPFVRHEKLIVEKEKSS